MVSFLMGKGLNAQPLASAFSQSYSSSNLHLTSQRRGVEGWRVGMGLSLKLSELCDYVPHIWCIE